MFLKILADQECNLYVDGSFVCLIPSEELTKVPFEKGEYIVRFECTSFPELIIENDLVLEYDKVERLDFNQELQKHPDFISKHDLVPQKNRDGLWGYVIRRTTLWAIPPVYDMARPFYVGEGYAIVYNGDTAAAINKRNEFIIPFGTYSNLSYEDRLFIGIDSLGHHIAISQTGHIIGDITECGLTPIRAFKEFICMNNSPDGLGKWYGVFLDGCRIEELGEFDSFGELKFPVDSLPSHCYYIEKDNLIGVVLINNSTHSAKWVKECSMVLSSGDNDHADQYFDRHSEYIFGEPKENSEYIYDYYPSLELLVEKKCNNQEDESSYDVCIYGINGNVVFQREQTTIDYFQDGFTFFRDHEKDEQYALNKDGRIIGPHVFRTGFLLGYAQISEDDKYGLVDESDTIVIPCKYDYVDWIDRVCTFDESKKGFPVDLKDYQINAWMTHWLDVLVKKDGECGIFSIEKGEMLIPLSYKKILYKESGYYCEMDRGWDVYSYQGKRINTGGKICPNDNED